MTTPFATQREAAAFLQNSEVVPRTAATRAPSEGYTESRAPKKHQIVNRPNTVGDDTPPAAATPLRVWSKIFEDEQLVVYAAVTGRSSAATTPVEMASNDIALTVDFRCRKHDPQSQPLQDVMMRQENGDAVILATRLEDKSRRVPMTVRIDREAALHGEQSDVNLHVWYVMSQKAVSGVAQLKIPFFHLLQPLKIDEDAVLFMMKSRPGSFANKASDTRRLSQPVPPHQSKNQLLALMATAAEQSHLHWIHRDPLVPTEDSKNAASINGVLVGALWSPDIEIIEGLDHQRATMADPSALGTVIVLGLVTLGYAQTEGEEHLQLSATFRCSDTRLCERLCSEFGTALDEVVRNSQSSG